ncbi:hypothetical protein M3J09_002205 [Ascochyta lentis]
MYERALRGAKGCTLFEHVPANQHMQPLHAGRWNHFYCFTQRCRRTSTTSLSGPSSSRNNFTQKYLAYCTEAANKFAACNADPYLPFEATACSTTVWKTPRRCTSSRPPIPASATDQ